MEKDAVASGACCLGDKPKGTIGNTIGGCERKSDGVVDQAVDDVQHAYKRAKSITGDVGGSVPRLAGQARDQLRAAGEHATAAVKHGGEVTISTVRERPAIWAVAASLAAVGVASFIHARR